MEVECFIRVGYDAYQYNYDSLKTLNFYLFHVIELGFLFDNENNQSEGQHNHAAGIETDQDHVLSNKVDYPYIALRKTI